MDKYLQEAIHTILSGASVRYTVEADASLRDLKRTALASRAGRREDNPDDYQLYVRDVDGNIREQTI